MSMNKNGKKALSVTIAGLGLLALGASPSFADNHNQQLVDNHNLPTTRPTTPSNSPSSTKTTQEQMNQMVAQCNAMMSMMGNGSMSGMMNRQNSPSGQGMMNRTIGQ